MVFPVLYPQPHSHSPSGHLASGHPCATQAQKASFFSLMVFLMGSRLLPQQARMTFHPHFLVAASTVEFLKMAHQDSMSLNSPGKHKTFFSRLELKTLKIGTKAQCPFCAQSMVLFCNFL